MGDFIVALGLLAVIEGVLYAAMPSQMRKAMGRLIDLPDGRLRAGGLIAMAAGVTLVWLVRG